MSTKFRSIRKQDPRAKIPRDLEARIRLEAARTRESLSAILSKYVVIGMGRDLADYGLEHLRKDQPTPAA